MEKQIVSIGGYDVAQLTPTDYEIANEKETLDFYFDTLDPEETNVFVFDNLDQTKAKTTRFRQYFQLRLWKKL